MTMVSELVLTRNQLLDIVRRHDESEFKVPLQRLSNVTAELQDGVMRTRMQPIGNAWQKLPRIVRDLSAELGKDIELEMHGADTELDRQVLERIKDPLTHMVRNSADHGLEARAERIAAGKPEKGIIRLSAYHEGGHIIIGVADDGRGLDIERIRDKALANGLATEAELDKMSEAQIQKFIFTPGFSTAQQDHQRVRPRRRHGRGAQQHRSDRRQHRRAVGAGQRPELHHQDSADARHRLGADRGIGRRAFRHPAAFRGRARSRARQVRASHRAHQGCRGAAASQQAAAARPPEQPAQARRRPGDSRTRASSSSPSVGAQTFGVVVDSVFHTEEIVVKPMATKLRHIGMFSGNTILGDGSVIMIIDPNGVSQEIGTSVAVDRGRAGRQRGRAAAPRPKTLVSLLVFRAGSPEPKAVPLSLVTRLEEIDCKKIELSNGRHMVQYRGQLMPLVRVSDEVKIKRDGAQPLLVFSDGNRSMGLVVDEIVDIVEDKLDIQVGSDRAGVLGSAVVRGQATEIIDVGHFLPLAYADWFRGQDLRMPQQERTLLLVDDSAFFRNMLSPVLKAAGYEVTAVSSGAGGAGDAQEGPAVRCAGHRHRHAGHGRLRAGRGRARRAASSAKSRSSRCRRTARRNRSSAAARSASTTTSPSSIARASSRRSRSRPPTSSRRLEAHHGHRTTTAPPTLPPNTSR